MKSLHCIRYGDGSPILFVHGNPSTHTLWRPLTERLADSFTVIAIDLPGFGASGSPLHPTEFRLQQMAASVAHFCREHHLHRFHLVGHSFGAAVSATLATLQPEMVLSLALITPLGLRTPPVGRLATIGWLRRAAVLLWPRLPVRIKGMLAKGGARLSYGPAYHPIRAAEIAQEAQRHDLPRSMSLLMMEADLQEYRNTLRNLQQLQPMPLLLVGAGEDRIVPFAQFQQVAALLPRAQRHIFPDSGHVPMWQYPAELEQLLREHLAKRD
ncbi:MAG: alpha/beta fold hydrolase [Armatimonadetes bacterium]|nr:alpha/beta fold hydrolase [Armatimonadota bacterium]